MKKILILAGRYLPGYKDGGPVRTLINLTDLLGDEYEFRLAVLDRDHGDTEPYPNIKYKEWNEVGKAKVWYYRQGEMKNSLIRTLAKDVDLIYLCGFYDAYGYKTLILNRLGRLYKKPVVVASMGSFTAGALSQKSFKKKTFIKLCKFFGLFKKIKWSATSELEREDTYRVIGKKAQCIIAEDLPRSVIQGHKGSMSEKGHLKIAFLARICKHKNLSFLVDTLYHVKGNVKLTIGGAIYEEDYWAECKEKLENLASNVEWEYVGEVPSEKVPDFFATQDVMVLPTLGENYGHVVYEAMSSGCVPVISDKTPWNWIGESGCGYVLPLEESAFVERMQALVDLEMEEKEALSHKAVSAACEKLEQSTKNTGYRTIFGE